MATRREYLIDLNLAKPGRGRFSREAVEALTKAEAEGVVFDEPVVTPRKAVATASVSDASDHGRPRKGASSSLRLDDGRPAEEPGLPRPVVEPQLRIRPVSAMYAVDEDGHVIGFSVCRKCAEHVSFCNCKEIGLPSIAVRLLDRTDPLVVS